MTVSSALGALAPQEMRNYVQSKLFWVGLALTLLGYSQQFFFPDASGTDFGTPWLGLVTAAGLGVFGIGVMIGLVRRSDRLAATAGAAAISERTRTMALASAAVVPGVIGLLLWVVAVVGFHVQGYDVPNAYHGVSDAHVAVFMFGQGPLAAVGGPLLGLVVARYLHFRGVAALVSVSMIIVTILMQGIFQASLSWRMVWVWTQWASPVGLDGRTTGGEDAFGFLPGSPYFWVLYLVTLCALGIVTAVYHDPETNRPAIRRAAVALIALATVFAVLSSVLGPDAVIVNPIAS
jgi:hypothetical protein